MNLFFARCAADFGYLGITGRMALSARTPVPGAFYDFQKKQGEEILVLEKGKFPCVSIFTFSFNSWNTFSGNDTQQYLRDALGLAY